jgi:hypothetical protein
MSEFSWDGEFFPFVGWLYHGLFGRVNVNAQINYLFNLIN